MSPLFQLVLFNFLFRWPPLFGRTFYSTTGFIQQLFYSTAYLLSLIPTVLFNSCSHLIQLFIPMAALIWSHFLFNFLFLFNLNGCPYLVTLILFPALLQLIYLFGHPNFITTDFFLFFFPLEKKVSHRDSNPGPLGLQSGCLPLDHHRTHHHHLFIYLFIFQLFFFFFFFFFGVLPGIRTRDLGFHTSAVYIAPYHKCTVPPTMSDQCQLMTDQLLVCSETKPTSASLGKRLMRAWADRQRRYNFIQKLVAMITATDRAKP